VAHGHGIGARDRVELLADAIGRYLWPTAPERLGERFGAVHLHHVADEQAEHDEHGDDAKEEVEGHGRCVIERVICEESSHDVTRDEGGTSRARP
jgi:hypothetical protein